MKKEVCDLFSIAIKSDGAHFGGGPASVSEGCLVESFARALPLVAYSSYLPVQKLLFDSNNLALLGHSSELDSEHLADRGPACERLDPKL